MATRLFSCTSISADEHNSLKEIDAADCIGDGSNVPLVAGDRAVVWDLSGKTVFYALLESAGHTDDGFEEVIPENNPGDFYWKCQGYTKGTFTGALTGNTFDAVGGSQYPPTGFTKTTVPYEELPMHALPDMTFSSDADSLWDYYGWGMYDGYMYIVVHDLYMKQKWPDGVMQRIETAESGIEWYWNFGHCAEDVNGSSRYFTEIGSLRTEPTVLNRFDMKTQTIDSVPINYPGGWVSWYDYFGDSLDRWTLCMRYKDYQYMIGSEYGSTVACKVNIFTGDLTELTNANVALDNGCFAIDYTNEYIYFIGTDGTMQRLTVSSDAWYTCLACPSTGIWEGNVAWLDEVGGEIILPVWNEGTYIYDIALNTWASYTSAETGQIDPDFNGGYVGSYKGIGGIWPYGYSPYPPYRHALIAATNPMRITKV